MATNLLLDKEYQALRHTCGYKGTKLWKFDPTCEKCVARKHKETEMAQMNQAEDKFRDRDITTWAGRKPSLDDYDNYNNLFIVVNKGKLK